MADDGNSKGVIIPLAHDGKGTVRGVLVDEAGVHPADFRKVEDGQPIMGEVLQVVGPVEGTPFYEVERTRVLSPAGDRHGPAMVNSDAYRDGWDLIWGKGKVAEA